MTKLLEAQRHVNQTMVAHMNTLTAAQETQSVALAQLVENTHQREFDKMFNDHGQGFVAIDNVLMDLAEPHFSEMEVVPASLSPH